jgi:hypothetical protein
MADELQANQQARGLETTSARVIDRLSDLNELFEELLLSHSRIKPPERTPGMIWIGPESWLPLSPEGQRIQGRILRELDTLEPLVRALTHGAPDATRTEVGDALPVLRDTADQSSGTWADSPEEVLADVREKTATITAAIGKLYDPTPGETLVVPDANAVIWNPAIEDWRFDGLEPFAVAFTSTLLSELDELKMRDKNESVREKAESAIRRIAGYRARGDLRLGVPLRTGVSTARMFSIEPRFENTLPWLDPANRDDRLLAQAIEVMRAHPHSAVALVTLDINLTTKADLAEIPVIAPPDPPATAPKRPRLPEVKILSLRPIGGSERYLDFLAEVQNRDTKPVRLHARGEIGGVPVEECDPDPLDLLVNEPPKTVRVVARRGAQGNLVPAFNNETTLYGKELVLSLVDENGNVVTSRTWTEVFYEAESNRDRYELQQAIWRIARGEGTEEDLRRDAIADLMAQHLKG